MDLMKLDQVSFTYPGLSVPALSQVSLSVASSQFIIICGPSGCGKTTLVRNLKREIAPHGKLDGKIFYRGKDISQPTSIVSAADIGFVMQDPDNQVVTDTVWHELAFGLENLGLPTTTIRRRVAETAHFFGINTWFNKSVFSLSGGQKQVLNLAAVMAMQPDLIILDEPVAQLDPIAAKEFLSVLKRIHLELGTTVIMTEHMLEDVFPLADKVVYMEQGSVKFFGTPQDFVLSATQTANHPYVKALPSAVQIARSLDEHHELPITVNQGRIWLKAYLHGSCLVPAADYGLPGRYPEFQDTPLLSAKDVWFRYNPDDDFVLKGFSCDINEGQILSIVGGNGSGKSTALNILAGLSRPQRGRLKWRGKDIKTAGRSDQIRIAMLPQNPKVMFIEDTVADDLLEGSRHIPVNQAEMAVEQIAQRLNITHLLHKHPYDLSGGEQQKAALGKLMLLKPQVMLLDEPTKGLDIYAKDELAGILRQHCSKGGAVVIVTHDVEFAAQYSDTCAMIFNGEVTCLDSAKAFFAGNTFYTTSANRMSRGMISDAVTCEDVVNACRSTL